MKLLFCPKCDSIFKLSFEVRSCECGKVKGHYINHADAVVNGEGYSLAVGNGSFVQALLHVQTCEQPKDWRDNPEWNKWWDARPKDSGLFLAWARPHCEEANRHTTINKAL